MIETDFVLNFDGTSIERAEKRAMNTLNAWVDALQPKFNAVEILALKQRLVAAFREYETKIDEFLRDRDGWRGQATLYRQHIIMMSDRHAKLVKVAQHAVNSEWAQGHYWVDLATVLTEDAKLEMENKR